MLGGTGLIPVVPSPSAREFRLEPAPGEYFSYRRLPRCRLLPSRSGLGEDHSAVGFVIVGFGCATCIGYPSPLPAHIKTARRAEIAHPVTVLSGNRNFSGRVHPDLGYVVLMGHPLVLVYTLADNVAVGLEHQPVDGSSAGRQVHLSALCRSAAEVARVMVEAINPAKLAFDFRAASPNQL